MQRQRERERASIPKGWACFSLVKERRERKERDLRKKSSKTFLGIT
jgi:hypothetical protein